jgi:hypothetical protein
LIAKGIANLGVVFDCPIDAADLSCGVLHKNSRRMRALLARNGVGALRLASANGEIFAGSFAKRAHQVVRRYAAVVATPLLSFKSARRVSFDCPSMKVRSRMIRSSV